jgi:lauroyl/myristoyl acyltransferase
MIKNLTQYLAAAEQIEESIETMLTDIQSDAIKLGQFLASASNHHRFLPDVEMEDIDFYKKILFNRHFSKAIESQTDFQLINDITAVEGDISFLNDVEKKPYIFSTFHYGPIGAIAIWLQCTAGFNLSMLAISQGVSSEMLHKDANSDFDIIPADSADVMLKMLYRLREGKSLQVSVDGMWGVTKDDERKSFARINFLGNSFCCKKGIPLLSYSSGVPIIPVIARRDPLGKIILHFDSPIYPDRKIPKDFFVTTTLQKCYDSFAQILRKHPDQWEFWMIIDQLFEESKSEPVRKPTAFQKVLNLFREEQYRFNREIYEVCNLGEKKIYLFNRRTKNCFGISRNLSHYLRTLPTEGKKLNIVRKQINQTLLSDLVSRKVLIVA